MKGRVWKLSAILLLVVAAVLGVLLRARTAEVRRLTSEIEDIRDQARLRKQFCRSEYSTLFFILHQMQRESGPHQPWTQRYIERYGSEPAAETVFQLCIPDAALQFEGRSCWFNTGEASCVVPHAEQALAAFEKTWIR